MAAPDVSIVIPTYNRRARLSRVLDALSRQTVAPDRFEVVVVDDGSSDGTTDWLRAWSAPFPLRALRQENSGPALARNAGVRAAAAPLALFIDDDVVPAPELVGEHLRSHAAEKDIAVIGPLLSLSRYAQPWVQWEQTQVEKQYRAMAERRWRTSFRQFWTGNASVAREHVLAVGGFDPAYLRAEDIELAARMERLRGVRFRFNPAAAGVHHAERSLASWMRMHDSYGRLESAIFRQFGAAIADDYLADNWGHLHPMIRRVVSACLEAPRRRAAIAAALRAFIAASAFVPGNPGARAACSVLANLLYWGAAFETIGKDATRSVFALAAQLYIA